MHSRLSTRGSSTSAKAPIQRLTDSQPDVIRFAPSNLVAGIVFHLRDQRRVVDVAADSINDTRARLEQANLLPEIERAKWQTMKHPQRLEWLLNESQAGVKMVDGVAVLTPPAAAK